MLTTMQHAKVILDEIGIESFLDCGTLLKMYRDNVPDYFDCDFSIMSKDSKKLKDNIGAFKKYDFELVNEFGFPELGLTELSFLCGSYKLDIFIKFLNGKWAYHVSTYNSLPLVAKFPRKHFIKLVDFILPSDASTEIDRHWNIPSDVEGYLESYYGKEWRIPNARWTYNMAPCIDSVWTEKIK